MKKTIKILVIICVSICANFSHSQQTADTYDRNFKLGIAINGGLPLNDPYSLNVGGDIRLQYNISTSYVLCFTVGYNNLSIQDNIQDIGAGNIFADSNGSSLSYIPIKVGYKTFLFQNEFYIVKPISLDNLSLTRISPTDYNWLGGKMVISKLANIH
jgi:hypothetical protein